MNILGGSVDILSTMQVGHLTVELVGEMKKQDAAIEWFGSSDVTAEVIYNGL
ncbi:MAG: NIL domain-containing protein [Fusobacteriaceae bacterium]